MTLIHTCSEWPCGVQSTHQCTMSPRMRPAMLSTSHQLGSPEMGDDPLCTQGVRAKGHGLRLSSHGAVSTALLNRCAESARTRGLTAHSGCDSLKHCSLKIIERSMVMRICNSYYSGGSGRRMQDQGQSGQL